MELWTIPVAVALIGQPAASAGKTAVPADSCDTVQTCVVLLRALADPCECVGPSQEATAKKLQGLGPSAIAPTIELLQDPEKKVQELAGYVLRDMPGLGPEHLGALEHAVEAGNGWLPPAIASIGTPSAIRFLVEQLRREPETHTQLTYAFEKLGPAAFPDLLELYRCGTSCDERLLSVVGFIFSEVRDKAAGALDSLEKIATDPSEPLVARRHAIRTLGALGPTARPVVRTLIEMSHQGPAELQADARAAVVGIGGAGTGEVLAASLESAEEKLYLLRDIAALRDGGREAGGRVVDLLTSSDRTVRVAAARTLGVIGYRPSTSALIAALDDADDWRLVYVAAEALGRLRASDARAPLKATATGHWYPPVRDAATAALKALDAKPPARLTSEPFSAFEFFAHEHAGRDYPSCADKADYPAMPQPPEILDPAGQPELARQLAYEREVVGWGEDGKHTSKQRTIPEVGIHVEAGWLVGSDQGEWGGELVLKPETGPMKTVLDTNIASVHVLGDAGIVAVTGLAHLVSDAGRLYTITCASAATCRATEWKQLPGAPRSSWITETGELLVNTTQGSVLVAPDGSMRMAPCTKRQPQEQPPAEIVPEPVP
jgi:HEAT repeat protein